MVGVFSDDLPREVKNILYAISNQEKSINYRKLSLKRDIRDYRPLKELFKDICYTNRTIEETERIQDEFKSHFVSLGKYGPKKPEYKKEKINLLDNAKNFYDGREIIIIAFKNDTFPFYHDEEESRFKD